MLNRPQDCTRPSTTQWLVARARAAGDTGMQPPTPPPFHHLHCSLPSSFKPVAVISHCQVCGTFLMHPAHTRLGTSYAHAIPLPTYLLTTQVPTTYYPIALQTLCCAACVDYLWGISNASTVSGVECEKLAALSRVSKSPGQFKTLSTLKKKTHTHASTHAHGILVTMQSCFPSATVSKTRELNAGGGEGRALNKTPRCKSRWETSFEKRYFSRRELRRAACR